MNVKLSVYNNRTQGLSGFVLCKGGEILDVNVNKNKLASMKAGILDCLARGLRSCRGEIQHTDILYIELQNQHVCEWLSGKKDYKEYDGYLDAVYDVLETLDCRYRFVCNKSPFAVGFVKAGKTEMDVQSVVDALADLK